ncbi:MAG: hypothetical protein D3903_16035 [Candidatus Electrothrix sp. GM3_4]|nr:hypothetical protein [Candidatus Electrothrix sp. GM3_4]
MIQFFIQANSAIKSSSYMTDHTVTLSLYDPREISDTDWQGRILEHGRALNRLAKMECIITSDEINAATAFQVSFPRNQIQQTDRIAETLACFACLAIPRYFASLHKIDIFSLQNISLLTYIDDEVPNLTGSYDYGKKIECQLHDGPYDKLLIQTKEYANVRDAFQHAVDKLSEYSDLTPQGFSYHSPDVLLLLRFLDNCLHAADLGHLSGWYSENNP